MVSTRVSKTRVAVSIAVGGGSSPSAPVPQYSVVVKLADSVNNDNPIYSGITRLPCDKAAGIWKGSVMVARRL